MAQDELILVLQHTHLHSHFRHHTRLSLVDPARVLLMDGEHVLTVRNHLLLDQKVLYLFYLPPTVPHILRILRMCALALFQDRETILHFLHDLPALAKVVLDPRLIAPLSVCAHLIKSPPHTCRPKPKLAPAPYAIFLAYAGRGPNQTAYRIPQQTDIGGPVHMRLRYRRIGPAAKQSFRPIYFTRRCPLATTT